MRFVWDEKKNRDNIKKHKLSFERAVPAFFDPVRKEYYDGKHSGSGEDRFMLAGTAENRILLIIFAEPEADTIRIISARKAAKREVEVYYYGNG
jgi:uncharacterized DUF497 family protein